MNELDAPSRALVRLAARIALGDESLIRARAREALADGVPPGWGDELLLQSILMVGYPRSLVAAQAWREAVGRPAQSEEDGADFSQLADWRARGEQTARVVYGSNFDKLRDNIAALHPAIEAWMVVEGYGRTLGRPGLDLARRELCIVAQVTVLRTSRQLLSHLKGALHAGVAPQVVERTFEAIEPEVGEEAVVFARGIWGRIVG